MPHRTTSLTNRPPGLKQVNFVMDTEAVDILERFAPSQRSRGISLAPAP